jgi:hypothetical protein
MNTGTVTFEVRSQVPIRITVQYLVGKEHGQAFKTALGTILGVPASDAIVQGSTLHDALSYVPVDSSASEEFCSLIGNPQFLVG